MQIKHVSPNSANTSISQSAIVTNTDQRKTNSQQTLIN